MPRETPPDSLFGKLDSWAAIGVVFWSILAGWCLGVMTAMWYLG